MTDAVDAGTRRFYEPAFNGSALNLAGWARKLTGKPSVAFGSVGLNGTASDTFMARASASDQNIALAAQRLASGELDLISIGRSLIGAPD